MIGERKENISTNLVYVGGIRGDGVQIRKEDDVTN